MTSPKTDGRERRLLRHRQQSRRRQDVRAHIARRASSTPRASSERGAAKRSLCVRYGVCRASGDEPRSRRAAAMRAIFLMFSSGLGARGSVRVSQSDLRTPAANREPRAASRVINTMPWRMRVGIVLASRHEKPRPFATHVPRHGWCDAVCGVPAGADEEGPRRHRALLGARRAHQGPERHRYRRRQDGLRGRRVLLAVPQLDARGSQGRPQAARRSRHQVPVDAQQRAGDQRRQPAEDDRAQSDHRQQGDHRRQPAARSPTSTAGRHLPRR